MPALKERAMAKPRKQLIAIEDTPYYQLILRCVRRAFLCGSDGDKNYEHRRACLVDRIRLLASLCGYHIMLKLSAQQVDNWPDDDVITGWLTLFKGPALVQSTVARSGASA
jgi:hypothetical protein